MFGSRPGKRAGPFSRRHVKNFTASLRRPYGIAPYNCGVIKPNTCYNQTKLLGRFTPTNPPRTSTSSWHTTPRRPLPPWLTITTRSSTSCGLLLRLTFNATPATMYDDHLTPQPGWISGAQFETFRPLTPDWGCQYQVERMRETGYTLYQDHKQEGKEGVCRWWFRNLKAWHDNQDRLEGLNYEAIAPLKPV